ncbi:MAG: DUF167 domain-containing protein [Treponema sp.]|nr:DUF167 domain-containing protein [Treponema sp.]
MSGGGEPRIRPSGDRLLLDLKVQPGASKSELAGIQQGRLRVRIAAAPEDGKANRELAAFFARLLCCSKGDLALKTGEKSRLKTLAIPSKYGEALGRILEAQKLTQ